MIYKGDSVGGRDRNPKRTCRLQFYVTSAEYKRLLRLAERQTMSISAFVRAQAIYQKIPCRITPIARKTYVALGRIQSDLTRLRRVLKNATLLPELITPEQQAQFSALQTQLSTLETRVRQIQGEVINLPTMTTADETA